MILKINMFSPFASFLFCFCSFSFDLYFNLYFNLSVVSGTTEQLCQVESKTVSLAETTSFFFLAFEYSILRLLRLLRLSWFIESWMLLFIYNGTNKSNETRFSSLSTLLAIISAWNSSWMFFYICHKCTAVVVTTFNLLSFCSTTTDKFLWKNVSEIELGKRFGSLNWKGPFNGPPQR